MAKLWVLVASLALARVAAQTDYYLYTGIQGAQTQIDVDHTSTWSISVSNGPLAFGGAKLTMKKGSSTDKTVTFSLYSGTSATGTLLATKTLTANDLTGSFAETLFQFSPSLSLATGSYFATLTSPAPDTQSKAYFIKGYTGSFVSLDGQNPAPNVGVVTVAAPRLTLQKTGPTGAPLSTNIEYTLKIGNEGTAAIAGGTTIKVSDLIPTGATYVSAVAGTGVTNVVCGAPVNSLLTCDVTLAAAGIPVDTIASSGPAFTITVTTPGTSGTITNYASVSEDGTGTPPAPGNTCTTPNCALATTGVAVPSLTLQKTAPNTAGVNSNIVYTLQIGNQGISAIAGGTTIKVSDLIPTGATYVSAVAGTGVTNVVCGAPVNSLLTCDVTLAAAGIPVDTITSSGPAFTITVTTPGTSGTITNYASVPQEGTGTPPAPGDTCTTPNCATATTTVGEPSLTLQKTAPNTAGVNSNIVYTLQIGNRGIVDLPGGASIQISDLIPTGATYLSAAAGTGVNGVQCTFTAATSLLSCVVTLAAAGIPAETIASSGPAFTITVTTPSTQGPITNYASVPETGAGVPPAPGNTCTTPNCALVTTTVTCAESVPNCKTYSTSNACFGNTNNKICSVCNPGYFINATANLCAQCTGQTMTSPASNVDATSASATLNGKINFNAGCEMTNYYQYSVCPFNAWTAKATTNFTTVATGAEQNVQSMNVSGLQVPNLYCYRLVTTSPNGQVFYGDVEQFQVSVAPPPPPGFTQVLPAPGQAANFQICAPNFPARRRLLAGDDTVETEDKTLAALTHRQLPVGPWTPESCFNFCRAQVAPATYFIFNLFTNANGETVCNCCLQCDTLEPVPFGMVFVSCASASSPGSIGAIQGKASVSPRKLHAKRGSGHVTYTQTLSNPSKTTTYPALGLSIRLPVGSAVIKTSVRPAKPSLTPTIAVQPDGVVVSWGPFDMRPRQKRTFRIKIRVSNLARGSQLSLVSTLSQTAVAGVPACATTVGQATVQVI